jgi:hypothetical protein
VSPLAQEQTWVHADELRAELNRTRELLIDAAGLMAEVCRVTNLHAQPTLESSAAGQSVDAIAAE